MNVRLLVGGGAALVYLAFVLWLSYGVWAPYDGVRYEPAWAGTDAVVVPLLAAHALLGLAAGRLWALALPLLWGFLSLPAEGYDVPIGILILMGSWIWLTAVLAGLAARWIAGRVVGAY